MEWPTLATLATHLTTTRTEPPVSQVPGGLVSVRLVAALAVLVTAAGVGAVLAFGDAPPIEQPMSFSHRIHVGQVGLDCQFCHTSARRSTVAGLPPLTTCRGCHLEVRPDSELVAPIHAAWEQQKPIEWMQVHDLPEYVRFDHSAHVNRGVDCSTCHGDVASMETAQREVTHSMGFCVQCHSDNAAPLDCTTCHY